MKIKKTKIISTIGPSCNSHNIISSLIKKVMDVARLNMAHTHKEKDLKSIIDIIRSESKKSGRNIAIMMDIAGPKIRVNFNNKDSFFFC